MSSSLQCSTGFRGTGPTPARGSGGSFGLDDSGVEANLDPLVGRKVWTRWPEDDCFYEAVIIDYNSAEVGTTVYCAILCFWFGLD